MDYMNRSMARRVVLIAFLISLAIRHSDSYGFDAGAACSEKTARRGKAVILKSIPCDLSRQAYCDLPGTLYPWNAVRRFVNENQGMMKRMYGDVRHISVLRNEINNNDITLDDIEAATGRYSRAGWKRNKYSQATKANKNADLKIVPQYRRDAQTTRANDRSTKSRPTTTTTSTTTTTTTTSTTTTTAPSVSVENMEISRSDDDSVPLAIAKDAKKIKSPTHREKMTMITMVDRVDDAPEAKSTDELPGYEEIIEAAIEEIFINSNGNSSVDEKASTNSTKSTKLTESSTEAYISSSTMNQPVMLVRLNKSEPSPTISTTLRIHGLIKDDRITTSIPHQSVVEGNLNVYTTESSRIVNIASISNVSYATLNKTESATNDGLNIGKDEIASTGTQIDNNRVSVEIDDDDASDVDIVNDEIIDLDGSAKPDDSDLNDQSADKKPLEENSIGQLYQDVAEKEDPIIVDARGVNACPVKEEVVAPFWANNTRGEVLALLNLYPFEQYVHWEKCTQEHKQMYCRDGCRCEQQYRLHRLLAYDPHNECRGIFSDWFRFPSCCICKCYNIPIEYRVTSRSPRSLDKIFRDEHESAGAMSDDDDHHQHDNDEFGDTQFSSNFFSDE